MVKGEGNGCICLLTELRNKPHVSAALSALATSNSAKDMQGVLQKAVGPAELLIDLNFTVKMVKLHVSLLIQLSVG